MKNNIIICGYPKSGNTWLTRLTAELVHYPAIGFWCNPLVHDESIEGLHRPSNYQCFKAHHNVDLLKRTIDIYGNGSEKIIYVYRDPRAVTVSACNYFKFPPKYPKLSGYLAHVPLGLRFYYSYLHSDAYCMDLSVRSVVDGFKIDYWMDSPWRDHVEGFLEE